MTIGSALHRYGVPVYRLEEILLALAESLGLRGDVLSTPTSLLGWFQMGPDHGDVPQSRVYLRRDRAGDVDLDKLAALDRVGQRVLTGELSPRAGSREVRNIIRRPARYSWAVVIPAFALASGAFVNLLGANAHEVCVSAIGGLVIGLLTFLAQFHRSLGQAQEMVAATAAFLVASLGHYALSQGWFGETAAQGLAIPAVTIAGIIVIVPGLSLTVAMIELVTGHVISGTARLVSVGVVFLKLGFGVAVGSKIATEMLGPMVATSLGPRPDGWMTAISLVAVASAFTLILQAHMRDWPWIVLVGSIALYSSHWALGALGPMLGPVLPALLVTATSNLYSRIFRRLAMIPLVPGLLLQVPGSLAYRSVSQMFQTQTIPGIETAFGAATIATAMVAGILLGNAIVSPRRRPLPIVD